MESVNRTINEAIDFVRQNRLQDARTKIDAAEGEIKDELRLLEELESVLKKFRKSLGAADSGLKSALNPNYTHGQYSAIQLEELRQNEAIISSLMKVKEEHLPRLVALITKVYNQLITE